MVSSTLRFKGIAHPRPDAQRQNIADLDAREILASNLGSRGKNREPLPVLVEHSGEPVGRVLSSYKAPDGSLKVAGTINDPQVAERVRSGQMRGLSLRTQTMAKTGSIKKPTDRPMVRAIEEVSICGVPRRPGCYISHIDDEQVLGATHLASRAKFGTLAFAILDSLSMCFV